MNVLLDTCALLALARGELLARAAAALRAAPEAHVSAVSPWEVAIEVAGGKLRIAEAPQIHRDPFDRVIVALAHAQALTVLTSNEDIPRYPGVTVIW